MRILITGGAGFIGSALVRFLMQETEAQVVNVDILTYAARPEALAEVENNQRYKLEIVDICDAKDLRRIFREHEPDLVMHLAAESHVDRSIENSAQFIKTNVFGTYSLLEVTLSYWQSLPKAKKAGFRLHHVSTDEVFGSLGEEGYFTEESRYQPNNPYAATKAGSDHLVRAWHKTFKLPVVISNCCNNYGPFQFPEKLIPLMITKSIRWEPMPVYGNAQNVRDWLFVNDHARALWSIVTRGEVGETYNVGADSEMKNIDVVERICDIMDELVSAEDGQSRRELITFVKDRPGHDFRYAIDARKIRHDLGWEPKETFDTGLLKTVNWYLENREWWEKIQETAYEGERLGLTHAADDT